MAFCNQLDTAELRATDVCLLMYSLVPAQECRFPSYASMAVCPTPTLPTRSCLWGLPKPALSLSKEPAGLYLRPTRFVRQRPVELAAGTRVDTAAPLIATRQGL